MSDRQLQAAYASLLTLRSTSDRADCVPPIALKELVERLAAEAEMLRLLDHVMGCRACQREFELLRTITSGMSPRSGS